MTTNESPRWTPKAATAAVAAKNRSVYDHLNFADTTDFDNARRGLVAELNNNGLINNASGRRVWDQQRFTALVAGERPDEANPSLWRQTELLAIGGLFHVVGPVYQVRTADLSNIDFIESDNGIIVVDPLISAETAAEALALYRQHRGDRRVVAVIYTHSHPDHFGGVMGVITPEQLAKKEVEIYAPVGFMEAAVAESVLAGTAMARRAQYMYGNLLEVGPRGLLSNGLGLTTSTGRVNLIPPTLEITEPVGDYDIDGVTFTFLLAPETEAPAELLFYLPQWKALCSAEDACHVLHNLYTLRGAKTRDAKAWVHYLQVALDLFADADVVFAQHHWPTWGREEVRSFLAAQRDAYKFLHDQTLRLANAGFTMNEIAEQLDWPEDLGAHWANRGYYGSVSHNTKAVYNFYLGFFDANPAHLNPHPPVEQGKRYVALAGGGDALMASAAQAFAAADYRWVAELVSHLVFAEPDRRDARELLAETFEQLAYTCENGVWRNFYLSGAKELIEGPPEPVASSTGAAIASALSIDQLFDVLAVRLNGERAAGMRRVINFNFTDAEPFTIELIHSVLHAFRGRQDNRATLTITCPSTLLSQALRGEANLMDEIASGNVTIDGELTHLFDVLLLLDTPSMSFAIVEP